MTNKRFAKIATGLLPQTSEPVKRKYVRTKRTVKPRETNSLMSLLLRTFMIAI